MLPCDTRIVLWASKIATETKHSHTYERTQMFWVNRTHIIRKKKKVLIKVITYRTGYPTSQMFSPSSSFHQVNRKIPKAQIFALPLCPPPQVLSKQTTTNYTSQAQPPCLTYPTVNTILNDKTNSSFTTATQA